MWKKIIVFLIVFILAVSIQPGFAQSGGEDFEAYLPLVFGDYVDPSKWIGPESGKALCIEVNPFDANIVYVGTYGAGVFKSLDGGRTWVRKSIGLGNLLISSLAIDPQNPRILYAGTYRDKVYKSTNAGESWYLSSNGIQDQAIVYSIAIDPHNPDIVFIGTRGEEEKNQDGDVVSWRGVVYRSVNEGIDWTPVLDNVGGTIQDWAYDLAVNPKSHTMVFAATHEHGIYRSDNSGDAWQVMNNGLTDTSSRALAINPKDSSLDALYAGVWHQNGVYKSSNNASSWSKVWNLSISSIKVYNMDIDVQNPNNLYLVNFDSVTFAGGVYKTENAGATWKLAGLSGKLLYTVEVNPLKPSQVFAGLVDEGVYRSEDYGATWVESNEGLFNADVSSVLVSPVNENILIAGTDAGLYVSTNRGNEWNQIYGGAVADVVEDNNTQDHFVVLTRQGEIFDCTLSECQQTTYNKGLTQVSSDLLSSQNPFLEEDIALEFALMDGNLPAAKDLATQTKVVRLVPSANDSSMLYSLLNNGNLYRIGDQGNEWINIGLQGNTVRSFMVDPEKPENIFVATLEDNAIWKSCNAGLDWQKLGSIPGQVTGLFIPQTSRTQLYAATTSGLFLYEEANGWQFRGLDGVNITALAVHPDRSDSLLVGTDQGVFVSRDNGMSWHPGPGDLALSKINTITFDPNHPDRIYFGTQYQGIYRWIESD